MSIISICASVLTDDVTFVFNPCFFYILASTICISISASYLSIRLSIYTYVYINLYQPSNLSIYKYSLSTNISLAFFERISNTICHSPRVLFASRSLSRCFPPDSILPMFDIPGERCSRAGTPRHQGNKFWILNAPTDPIHVRERSGSRQARKGRQYASAIHPLYRAKQGLPTSGSGKELFSPL